jgi:energy-coupling factor transporter ATP-binding protein EcfA2
MKKEISLPPNSVGLSIVELSKSLLVVGANGAGKTRLGTWIEFSSPHCERVHRISAQKSLAMPDSTTPKSIDLATSELWTGHERAIELNNLVGYKQGSRWQGKPAISLLSDYNQLMVFLFSDHTEESTKYLDASKASTCRIEPPRTKLDVVKEIWEIILPHRELVIGGLRIQTKTKDSRESVYNSSEMSDGERVIFYLIGQCLAAPADAIIIIDEPELHLHKSVQAPLWDKIEQARPDCIFIYLTHDVDFASSMEEATKIWLKSYDGTNWDWDLIRQDESIPEDLMLEVLGSRKPIVFVEGLLGSFDAALYTSVLGGYLVVPVGSCSQVIQSVKALKNNSQLHHLEVFGIIDRDRRVPAEIQRLEQDSIFVLSVAEVENLFCTKEILEIISHRLARDAAADFESVSSYIFSRLQGELETQVSLRASSEIKYQLNLFDGKARGVDGLSSALQSLAGNIDVKSIYAQSLADFNAVLSTKDYEGLLALYNRKSLSAQASSALGLSNGSLPELVVRLVKSECRDEITNLLKKYFGNFAVHIA